MRYLLIALLLLFVGFFYVGAPKQVSEDRLWNTVNQWRVEQGKPAYEEDQKLCQFADRRAKEIQDNYSHEGFIAIGLEGSNELLSQTGFTFAGENLSSDFNTEKETLNAWLNSDTHRKNLNDSFKYSCIRCLDNRCVQLFGRI